MITSNNTMNRLAMPKSKLPCCSKNCNSKTTNISQQCVTSMQKKNMKFLLNNKPKIPLPGVSNNENDSLQINKANLIAKRSLYNEKIKNEALAKYNNKYDNTNSKVNTYRERSRCFNSCIKGSSQRDNSVIKKNYYNNDKASIKEIDDKDIFPEKEFFKNKSRNSNSVLKDNNKDSYNKRHSSLNTSKVLRAINSKTINPIDLEAFYTTNNKDNKNQKVNRSTSIRDNFNIKNPHNKNIVINNNNNYYINQIYQTEEKLKTNNIVNTHINELNNQSFLSQSFEIASESNFELLKTNLHLKNFSHYSFTANNNSSNTNFNNTNKQQIIDQLNRELFNKEIDRKLYCYKKLQSFKDWENYGREFKKQLFIDQQIHRRTKISQLFQNDFNKVSEKMRAKMIDWMIEVLHNYKTNDNTFFLSVELLDSYLTNNCSKLILPSDLHLIGCTCMFLASKIIDIRPLKLKTVYEKIAHEKLSMTEIKSQELEILRTLKFNVTLPTLFEYTSLYSYELFILLNKGNLKEEFISCNEICQICYNNDSYLTKEHTEETFTLIKKSINPANYLYNSEFLCLFKSVLVYIQKLICHDYKLMCEYPSILSAGTLVVSFKICEQITNCLYLNNTIISYLQEISEISNTELILVSQNILKLSQDFEEQYKGLENLKKIHISEITSFIVSNNNCNVNCNVSCNNVKNDIIKEEF